MSSRHPIQEFLKARLYMKNSTKLLLASLIGMLLFAVVYRHHIRRWFAGKPALATANAMGPHMMMTELKPPKPGDQERADAVFAVARTLAEHYKDYHTALAEGFTIFHPELDQPVYHFLNRNVSTTVDKFDLGRGAIGALVYKKIPAKDGQPAGYQFLSVMYLASLRDTEAQLNSLVPMSITQWHLHQGLCEAPPGSGINWTKGDPKFGPTGSIVTAADCKAAGGIAIPRTTWMTHVYPLETDRAKQWGGVGDDDDPMPGMKTSHTPDMKMDPNMKM
jgi:hypothetical protein